MAATITHASVRTASLEDAMVSAMAASLGLTELAAHPEKAR